MYVPVLYSSPSSFKRGMLHCRTCDIIIYSEGEYRDYYNSTANPPKGFAREERSRSIVGVPQRPPSVNWNVVCSLRPPRNPGAWRENSPHVTSLTSTCWTASTVALLVRSPSAAVACGRRARTQQQQQGALENYTGDREGSYGLADGFSLIIFLFLFRSRLPYLHFSLYENGSGVEEEYADWQQRRRCELRQLRSRPSAIEIAIYIIPSSCVCHVTMSTITASWEYSPQRTPLFYVFKPTFRGGDFLKAV